jgi:hypothetical protein
MFRATLCSSSGGQLYLHNFWYNRCVSVTVRYKHTIEEIVPQVGYLPELAKIISC